MTRRTWLVLALAAGACRKPGPPQDVFPETVGAWRRTAQHDLPASEAPDPVRAAAIRHLRTATYQGPGKLEARLYQVASSAVALDLVQRWRPAPDSVFFYVRDYVVVVKWERADRQALQDFVHQVETRLNPTGRKRAP